MTPTREAKRMSQRRFVAIQLATNADAYRAKRNEIRARWQSENREKHNAHNRVYRAIKSGVLVRPEVCERCGEACKPEASHDDYNRPLDVEWLCRLCHAGKDTYERN